MRVTTVAVLFCAAILAASLLTAGCGPKSGGASSGSAEYVITPGNPLCLQQYTLAREYSAAGRYELAREHYLLAYAAAGDDALLRDMLAKELNAVDLMIRSLR